MKPTKNSPLYAVALVVTGLGSLALGLLVWFLPPEQGFAALAGGWMPWGGRGRGFDFHGMGMMGPWGMIPMVLGFLFVVFVIAALMRRGRHHGHWHHGGMGHHGHHPWGSDPLGELAEAYAEGKITREQYLERKTVLEEDR